MKLTSLVCSIFVYKVDESIINTLGVDRIDDLKRQIEQRSQQWSDECLFPINEDKIPDAMKNTGALAIMPLVRIEKEYNQTCRMLVRGEAGHSKLTANH